MGVGMVTTGGPGMMPMQMNGMQMNGMPYNAMPVGSPMGSPVPMGAQMAMPLPNTNIQVNGRIAPETDQPFYGQK